MIMLNKKNSLLLSLSLLHIRTSLHDTYTDHNINKQ